MTVRFSVFSSLVLTVAACALFKPVDSAGTKPKASAPRKPAAGPAAGSDKAPASAPAAQPAATKAPVKPSSLRDQRAGLTDPNITAMVMALNNTDISYARVAMAPSHAERPDVKEFAARMLTDHTGVNGLVTELLGKLNVEPVDNTASLDLRDESANRRDAMRELLGFTFDSTYIENEVSYHQKFLMTIDSLMLPAAKNADLKKLLTAVRPAVAAHLAHAEQVRANVISRK